MATKPQYSRVLLKLSGEALCRDDSSGFDEEALRFIVAEVKELLDCKVEVALVIGAGNLCRGRTLTLAGLGQVASDQIGMLATIMNTLALQEVFLQQGIANQVFSAISIDGFVPPFDRHAARAAMARGELVILGGGTGNPFVTTDTTASLRARQLEVELVMKATTVDGVFSADPNQDPTAKRYEQCTYQQVLDEGLSVMDQESLLQCRNYQLPIRVFNFMKAGCLKRVVMGANEGTLITA